MYLSYQIMTKAETIVYQDDFLAALEIISASK